MALPSSGELGFDDIAAQLRYTQPYNYSCNFENPQWRGLAQRPTSQSLIGISNFYDKWAGTKVTCGIAPDGTTTGYSRTNYGALEGDFAGQTVGVCVHSIPDNRFTLWCDNAPGDNTSQKFRVTDNNMAVIVNATFTTDWNGTVVLNQINTTTNWFPNGQIRWFTWPA